MTGDQEPHSSLRAVIDGVTTSQVARVASLPADAEEHLKGRWVEFGDSDLCAVPEGTPHGAPASVKYVFDGARRLGCQAVSVERPERRWMRGLASGAGGMRPRYDSTDDAVFPATPKAMMTCVYLRQYLGDPGVVPTGYAGGREGAPIMFVFTLDDEDPDHSVIVHFEGDGRFRVSIAASMEHADLVHRVVGYCVFEGIPYTFEPVGPAAENEESADRERGR